MLCIYRMLTHEIRVLILIHITELVRGEYYRSYYIPEIWKFRWYYVFGCAAATAVSAVSAPHANACTGHNFVTNTPIKFIFAIAIEVPDSLINFIFGIAVDNTLCDVCICTKPDYSLCNSECCFVFTVACANRTSKMAAILKTKL